MWVPRDATQWLAALLLAVVGIYLVKRILARVLAGLCTRPGLDVRIKAISVLKLRALDLKISTGAFDVRVKASEVSIDRVKLIKAVSEAFFGLFRGPSFRIPVRVSDLVVTLDGRDGVGDGPGVAKSLPPPTSTAAAKHSSRMTYYYNLYLSRVAVFVACLFKVDINSACLRVSEGLAEYEVDLGEICVTSEQRNPVLLLQTIRGAARLRESSALVCETRLSKVSLKASSLEILDSGMRYGVLDVGVGAMSAAHTSDIELLASLVEEKTSREQNDRMSERTPADLLVYAPKKVNVEASNISVRTLEGKGGKGAPFYEVGVRGTSATLTQRTFSSFKDFQYTWQLLVTSEVAEARLEHHGMPIAEVTTNDIKSITTSTRTSKLVQNVIVNVGKVQVGFHPVREETLGAIDGILRYHEDRQPAEAEDREILDKFLGVQVAVNKVGLNFASSIEETVVVSSPHVSVNFQKKPGQGVLSHIDTRDLCLSLAKEGKGFLNSKLHAVRNQDLLNVAKIRFSSELLSKGGTGEVGVLDTDLSINGCEIQLASQYLLLADVADAYAVPLVSAARKRPVGESLPRGRAVNIRMQCADLALHFSPLGRDGKRVPAFEMRAMEKDVLLRLDSLSFSSLQGNLSNLHVKKLTLCKAANLDDSSGVLLYLTSVEDLTLTVSRVTREEDFQSAFKIWCSRFKVEFDQDSVLFLLELQERAIKDFQYVSSLPLLAHSQALVKVGERAKPSLNIQTHRLDIIFKHKRKDLRLSLRSLHVADERHFQAKYLSVFLHDKEVVKVKDLAIGLSPKPHNLEVTLRMKHLCGRLSDKLEVGKLLEGHVTSLSDLGKQVKETIEGHRGVGDCEDERCESWISLSLVLVEWEFEVENPQLETWLCSHKPLLQECHLGTHLVNESSQSSISVFDYFSPTKYEEKSKEIKQEQSQDNVYMYNQLIRSYIKACKQAEKKKKFFKNALRLSGKGVDASIQLCQNPGGSPDPSMNEIQDKGIVLQMDNVFLVGAKVTLKETFAHVCGMIDPFAHVKVLQITSSPLCIAAENGLAEKSGRTSNTNVSWRTCTRRSLKGVSEDFKIFGDILISIESLEGLYGVAMEPYFAFVGQAFQRFSPSKAAGRAKSKEEDLVNRLEDSLLEHFHFTIGSFKATLVAETDLPEDLSTANCYRVSMDDFDFAVPRKNTFGVRCKNFEVDASYKIHRGNALSSSVDYEEIPIFKSPEFDFSLSLNWRMEDGMASPKGTIAVVISFKKGEAATSPVIFAGERQIKCLAHVIVLLKDPPGALRDSFDRKPFRRAAEDKEDAESHKFLKRLEGLNFQIESDPLQIRFWDPLPHATDHVATLDVDDYELGMVFKYVDLRKKVANAKVRRVPKMQHISIKGHDIVFSLKSATDGDYSKDEASSKGEGGEEDNLAGLKGKIASLLGNTKGLDAFDDKESLVVRIESMHVSQWKPETDLLQKAPFKVQICRAKGLLTTFKRDALYTCIQTVASGINDVLNEHGGQDNLFEEACAKKEEPVAPEKEKEEPTGDASEQDLLSILLEKGSPEQRRQLASSQNQVLDSSVTKNMDLDFVIEALQPQFNFESEGANGRFLLSAEKAIVKGYKDFEDGVCIHQKSEINLQSIQMHICQLDIDPNAQVQWLDADQTKDRNLISANESLLHSVFDPCSLSLNLFQRGQHFEIDLDLSGLTLALDSREFEITSDVVSRIALSPFPKISEKISLSLLGSDMLRITKLDNFATPEDLESLKDFNRTAFESLEAMVFAQKISKRSEEEVEQNPGMRCPEASYLKEQMSDNMKHALAEKKDLVKKLMAKERKAKTYGSTNHKQTKVSLKVKEVKWSLCKDRKVFAEATLHKVFFSRVRYEDFSGITKFQIDEITCVASLVDERSYIDTYEVLSVWRIKEYDSVPFIHVYMVSNGESQGLSSFELCDITLHPIEIRLAQKTASELQKYFFHKSLSPDERHVLWSQVGSPAPKKNVNFAEEDKREEGSADATARSVGSSKASHKSTRSLDFSARSSLASLSESERDLPSASGSGSGHYRSLSAANSSISATEYLLEAEEEEQASSMIDLLNTGFPLSPSDRTLIRQDSLNKERGIVLNKVRVNELGIKLSFESVVLNVTDMKVYLDTFNYYYYKGTWNALLEKVKWNIIKSVVKNVAGFQFGKIRGLVKSSLATPTKKKLPMSRQVEEEKKKKRKSIFAWNRGESPPGSSDKAEGDTPPKKSGNDMEEKGKLLFGALYKK